LAEPRDVRELRQVACKYVRLLKAFSNQTVFPGLESGLRSVAGLQFPKYVGHVILDGTFRKEESAGDFSVAGTLRNVRDSSLRRAEPMRSIP